MAGPASAKNATNLLPAAHGNPLLIARAGFEGGGCFDDGDAAKVASTHFLKLPVSSMKACSCTCTCISQVSPLGFSTADPMRNPCPAPMANEAIISSLSMKTTA